LACGDIDPHTSIVVINTATPLKADPAFSTVPASQ
jgi:hypothetical protein